jgi:hypothetical protein
MDVGEAANWTSDASMDLAIKMVTAATAIATETVGATIFDPIQRNENGKRRKRSETTAAPSDWRSGMEQTIQQQAQELMQLHRTVGQLANLVEARAACKEAQQLAMLTWMQEREQKWDARYEDQKVWGVGITNMIAKTMKVVARGQDERER